MTALAAEKTEGLRNSGHSLPEILNDLLPPLDSIHGLVSLVLDDAATPVKASHRRLLDSAMRSVKLLRSMISGPDESWVDSRKMSSTGKDLEN